MPRISQIIEVSLSCQSCNLTENHSSTLAICTWTPTGRAYSLLLLLLLLLFCCCCWLLLFYFFFFLSSRTMLLPCLELSYKYLWDRTFGPIWAGSLLPSANARKAWFWINQEQEWEIRRWRSTRKSSFNIFNPHFECLKYRTHRKVRVRLMFRDYRTNRTTSCDRFTFWFNTPGGKVFHLFAPNSWFSLLKWCVSMSDM